MKQLEYNFKCNWDWNTPFKDFDNEHYRLTHLDIACNGNHIIKIDYDFYVRLIHRLIFKYNLTINKKFIGELITDFEEYFQNTIKSFENGEWDINHFHSIDIYVEIIHDYCELKYSNKE